MMQFTSSFYKEKIEKNKKDKYFNTMKENYIKYRYDTQRLTL